MTNDMDTIPSGVSWRQRPFSLQRLPREISSLIFALVYNSQIRAPTVPTLCGHLTHTVSQFRAKYQNCGTVLCSDFNNTDITASFKKTQSHSHLDLTITNLGNCYQDSITLSSIGRSDHLSMLWRPNTHHHINYPRSSTTMRRPMLAASDTQSPRQKPSTASSPSRQTHIF